ncbi:hypothetical protein [Corynebacterium halotolerans]|uniref:Uncharacterized protein n=1 Tax=Corynebacterium halotolerans YIM 70093 = DSM 44683 TaxID=1121362 RepID=M1P480_9CORY|nr:hypothetical protein [Corynebacterium halotolerans]AGF71451.1 hypothetical protein A605_02185 [Corynebacterium halotolerans YIM 70093 = DSM 44683]
MGRLLLILLIIVAVVLVWKAFGPGTWKRNRVEPAQQQQPRAIKGPDDDEEFLWTIEKNRFKERRAREEAERMRRAQKRHESPEPPAAPGNPSERNGRGAASAEEPEGEPEAGSDHDPRQ